MQLRDFGHEHRIAIVHVAGGGPARQPCGDRPAWSLWNMILRRGWRGGLLTPDRREN